MYPGDDWIRTPSSSSYTCVSESGTFKASHGRPRLLRPPTDFSVVTATDTNSTISGISGPGRIIDSLLNSAGAQFEKVMDRCAERWLHAGPTRAAHRLTCVLHKAHIKYSRERYQIACRTEHKEDIDDIEHICQQLIWVCNGICSQCKTPYVPYLLDGRMSNSIHKALMHLTEQLRITNPVPNIVATAIYVQILVDSHVFLCSDLSALQLPSRLKKALDGIQRTFWPNAPPSDAVDALRHTMTSIEEHSIIAPEACLQVATVKDTLSSARLAHTKRSLTAWIPLVKLFSCSALETECHNENNTTSEASEKEMLEIQALLNSPDIPPHLRERLGKADNHGTSLTAPRLPSNKSSHHRKDIKIMHVFRMLQHFLRGKGCTEQSPPPSKEDCNPVLGTHDWSEKEDHSTLTSVSDLNDRYSSSNSENSVYSHHSPSVLWSPHGVTMRVL